MTFPVARSGRPRSAALSPVFVGACVLLAGLLPGLLSRSDAADPAPAAPRTPAVSPLSPELAAKSAEEIEKQFAGRPLPEAVRMLLDMKRGSRMGAGSGWFGPARTRFTWERFAERHGIAPDGAIPKDKFRGESKWFARLDRNGDGRIEAGDLDWSDANPWVQQSYQINRQFRRVDADGDGRATREEWQAFFDRMAGGRPHVTTEDLRDGFLGGAPAGFLPGDAPTPDILLQGLLKGEVGSPFEGPALGDAAPDFRLKTYDGQRTVRLSEIVGPKPVVLVFGNYTCGPFRSMLPGVEEVARRFADEATFLAVYVREAHPRDGWSMRSNGAAGVDVLQPKTYDERVAVAAQCGKLLKTSMPLLVDEIDDPAGHAYSGMPARLYVIDRDGRVAYKGGRGPFGFKSGEMEQALVMLLLEQQVASAGKTPGR